MTESSNRNTVTPRLVSTIIPVYNRSSMMIDAVQSVLDQTYRPIEIIIADDGSTDNTPEIAHDLATAHEGVVRYVRHENAGPGPARELGRKVACGEFIQYLDSDDRLLPNKFADQVAALDQNPECDVAYGVSRLVDASGNVLADPFKWTAKEMSGLYPGLLVDRWWCTHTPLYRRSLTDRIGAWSDMRWSQDWEYDSRVGALGTRIVRCSQHVSEHYEHEGQRQTSAAPEIWRTDPVRLRNRVQLLQALWAGAQAANVPEAAPERQHFARWCFSIARQLAAQGMRRESLNCLHLASESAGSGPGNRGVNLYRLAVNLLGPKFAAALISRLKRSQGSAGQSTLDQSFT